MTYLRPRKEILLFSEMQVTKKIFIRTAAKSFFNQFEFSRYSLHLKDYSNSPFLC